MRLETASHIQLDLGVEIFLSCSDTNDEIQKQYIEDCRKNGIRAFSLSSFKDVWLKCTPHIKISTARSDVCSLSEKHRNAIREPITDAEKLDAMVISNQKKHTVQQ